MELLNGIFSNIRINSNYFCFINNPSKGLNICIIKAPFHSNRVLLLSKNFGS